MKTSLTKLKRVGLFGLALLLFITLFFPFIELASVSAQAEDQATFIDKVFIDYDGREWKDDHPYDDVWHYFAGPRSGVEGCGSLRHEMSIQNPAGSNPTASVIIFSQDDFGECTSTRRDGISFTESSLRRRFWNAYRRSADELFLPIGSKWDLGACGINNLPRFASYQTFLTPEESKLYRRQDDSPRNRYYEVDGDSLEESNLVETDSPSTGEFVIVGRCTNIGPDDRATRDFGGIVIAYDGESVNGGDRCIPGIYGVSGGACSPDRDPSPPGSRPGGDDEDGPPSCEEKNPGISLSWFLCSVINFFDNTVQGLTNVVDDLLQIDAAYYTDANLKTAWSYFRNIASFLLIVIGLVMIIGQAITKG